MVPTRTTGWLSVTIRRGVWSSLEQWSPTAFLIGGLLLAVNAAWYAANISVGAANYQLTGQILVGTGWTVALLGLLGLFPSLSDRSRWLSLAGAICAIIGVVTFAVNAIVAFIDVSGIVVGVYEPIGAFFIPGVVIGTVLGFVAFSVAVFRTNIYTSAFGVLLLVLPIVELSNIFRIFAGYTSEMMTLGFVIVTALPLLLIGYNLRNQSTSVQPMEAGQSTT